MPEADHQTPRDVGKDAEQSTPHLREGRRVTYQFGLPAATRREFMLVLEALGAEFEMLFECKNG